MRMKFSRVTSQEGLSLIELVIFIVILSISLTSITLVYINTTRESADPLMRIKSIELAQLMLNEVLLKRYDEQTPVGGGCVRPNLPVPVTPTRCNSGIDAETDATFGAETDETSRIYFDDVDDFHNQLYCGDNVVAANTACPTLSCQVLQDESGVDISALYAGFSVCFNVSFAGGISSEISFGFPAAQAVPDNDAKRIDVFVTDPVKSKISLTAYSLNY